MSHLSHQQQEALFAICLSAAFADGAKGGAERAEIKRISEQLLSPDFPSAGIYQRVLLGQQSLDAAAAALDGPGLRQLAYEMAVGVCDADDATSPAEQDFLDRLAVALGIDKQAAAGTRSAVDAVALAPVATAPALPEAALPLPETPPAVPAQAADPRGAEADSMTLKYAILNGALELLPESLATMAIIPLQMKLVYGIGRLYGFELDRGHVKEFLATAGVGLTSQVVEGYARKILGGLIGKKMLGGFGRAAADQVASSAFSFASTYALGQVARRYYAGGRTLSTDQLRSSFTPLLEQAKTLHSQYLPQIQREASTLDVGRILASVRGQR